MEKEKCTVWVLCYEMYISAITFYLTSSIIMCMSLIFQTAIQDVEQTKTPLETN